MNSLQSSYTVVIKLNPPSRSTVTINLHVTRETRGHGPLVKRSVSVAVIHVSLGRVSCPLGGKGERVNGSGVGHEEEHLTAYGGERSRNARGTEHGEGQHEDHDLSTAIEGAAQDIIVFPVPSRVVPTQPELRRQSDENARGQGGVHPGRLE